MKKIIKSICVIVLSFVLCLCIKPKNVYADMGVQEPLFDEVMIINEGGAYLDGYRKSTTIPYGEIVEVEQELSDYIYVYYGDYYGKISIYDVKPVMDELEPTGKMKNLKGTEYLYVFGDNAVLYKGPSRTFDVAEENVPKGTVLVSEYSGQYADSEWYYVEYKNNKGWIYYGWRDGEYQVAEYVSGKGSVLANTEVYDLPDTVNQDSTHNVISKVENEQDVKIICTYTASHGDWYYVKGKDCDGWVSEYNLIRENVTKDCIYLRGEQEEILYSDRNCTSEIGRMTFNGEYYIKSFGYVYDEFIKEKYEREYGFSVDPYVKVYEIEYEKGKVAYIRPENTNFYYSLSRISKSKPATLSQNHKIYSQPEENDEKVIGELEAGETIEYIYDIPRALDSRMGSWIGINTRTGTGWIVMDYSEAYDTIGYNYIYDVDNYVSDPTSANKPASPTSSFGSSIDTQTIILIVGAVVVAGLAGTSIFFFTRKPKSN